MGLVGVHTGQVGVHTGQVGAHMSHVRVHARANKGHVGAHIGIVCIKFIPTLQDFVPFWAAALLPPRLHNIKVAGQGNL